MQGPSRRVGIILGLLLVGAPAGVRTALARGTDGSWEAGAYYFVTHPDQESKIQDGQGGGLRVGWYRKANQEFEIDYDSASNIDSIRITGGPPPGTTFDVSKVTALYVKSFLPKGHEALTPTLIFGLGQISIDKSLPTGVKESSSASILRAGGGFKYFVKPRIAVRFDASIFSWYGSGDVTPTTRLYAFDVNLGVSILFGGKK